MHEEEESKVVALWLKTGKKLDTSKGIVITDKGFIVRLSDQTTLVIPPGSVVALECFFASKESVDKVFSR